MKLSPDNQLVAAFAYCSSDFPAYCFAYFPDLHNEFHGQGGEWMEFIALMWSVGQIYVGKYTLIQDVILRLGKGQMPPLNLLKYRIPGLSTYSYISDEIRIDSTQGAIKTEIEFANAYCSMKPITT